MKRIGILSGVCVPFASNKWYQEEFLKTMNEDENNIEIKIATVHHQEYSGKAMVIYATLDKETKTNQKLINMLK